MGAYLSGNGDTLHLLGGTDYAVRDFRLLFAHFQDSHWSLELKELLQNADAPTPDKAAFAVWLRDAVQLSQYQGAFEKHEYDSLSLLRDLDEETLRVEVGISKKPHLRKVMRKITEFTELAAFLDENGFKGYAEGLTSQFRIFSLADLKKELNDAESATKLRSVVSAAHLFRMCTLLGVGKQNQDADAPAALAAPAYEGRPGESPFLAH